MGRLPSGGRDVKWVFELAKEVYAIIGGSITPKLSKHQLRVAPEITSTLTFGKVLEEKGEDIDGNMILLPKRKESTSWR